MKLFRGLRGRVIVIGIVVAIVVAIPTIALTYVYTSTPLAQVTISGGAVSFEQGTIGGQGTIGDIGPSPQVLNASAGYPITVTAGTHFHFGIQLVNADSVPHELDAIHVAAPFTLVNVSAPIPLTIPASDDTTLYVTLAAPSTSGTYSFAVTVVSYR